MQHTMPCCTPLFDDVYPGMALRPDGAAAFHDFILHEAAPFIASRLPLAVTEIVLPGLSLGAALALGAVMLRHRPRRPSHQQQGD